MKTRASVWGRKRFADQGVIDELGGVVGTSFRDACAQAFLFAVALGLTYVYVIEVGGPSYAVVKAP